jgi:hypothetical protein
LSPYIVVAIDTYQTNYSPRYWNTSSWFYLGVLSNYQRYPIKIERSLLKNWGWHHIP